MLIIAVTSPIRVYDRKLLVNIIAMEKLARPLWTTAVPKCP